jgi:tetratricopeptide (TPR) repeat protein
MSQNKSRFISDQPIYEGKKVDALEIKKYARNLAHLAVNTEGPFTIGVHAEWGHGKTSLLRAIKHELEKKENNFQKEVIPVWFNAWKFELEKDPLIALILTIVASLEKYEEQHRSSSEKIKKWTQSFKDSCLDIVEGGLASITIDTGSLKSDLKKADEVIKENERERRDAARNVRRESLEVKVKYYKAFAELDEACINLNQAEVKIILLIDDLDRCAPDKAMRLLESIKLVLGQPGFIFFLGVDDEKLTEHIRRSQKLPEDATAKFFLDKIIQVPFYVPSHELNYDKFIKNLFLDQLSNANKKDFQNIKELLSKPLSYNPRSTIRIINTIILYEEMYRAQGNDQEEEMLSFFAVTVLLQIRFHTMYQRLKSLTKTQCNRIAAWDQATLGKISVSNLDEDLKSILELLKKESKGSPLLEILFSAAGKKWLTDEKRRHLASDFAYEQKLQITDTDKDPWTYITEGNDFFEKKDYDSAVKIYTKAIQLDPRFADAYYARGNARYDKKEYDKAIEDYNKAIELDPKDVDAYNGRGSAWYYKKKYDKAIEDFNKAIELDPKDALAYSNRAEVWAQTKEFNKAITDANYAIKLDANLADAYNSRGFVYEKMGKREEAKQDYKRALQIEPDHQQAKEGLERI